MKEEMVTRRWEKEDLVRNETETVEDFEGLGVSLHCRNIEEPLLVFIKKRIGGRVRYYFSLTD